MSENDEITQNQVEEQEQNLTEQQPISQQEGKVIDEANYQIRAPKEAGPTAVGRGGDPLFRRINATKEQLLELMEETQIVQDWLQREASNKVALSCLDNENLKDDYYKIKDGFGEYGKITLMGFKTPSGVEIPRLKVFDTNGEVLEVLSGPMAIAEIVKRAEAYHNTVNGYEIIQDDSAIETPIVDYTGNLNE